MKNVFTAFAVSIIAFSTQAQNNMGIGTSSPHATAAVDVTSTTQGMLVPRMTFTQRNQIGTSSTPAITPATGLLIYQTDNTPGFYFYNGTTWTSLSSSSGVSGTESSFGDASDGALTISGNTDWSVNPPAIGFQYSSITIASGATLTVPSGMRLHCKGNVTVSGTIVVATGAMVTGTSQTSLGISLSPPLITNTAVAQGLPRARILPYLDIPVYGGAAGCRTNYSTGGDGGGSFAIYASGSITVSSGATINAKGMDNTNVSSGTTNNAGGGGGGGGLVVLISKTSVTMAGTINVSGGNGSSGYIGTSTTSNYAGGGGGGGGIVCMAAAVAPSITGTLNLAGGTAGTTATGSTTSYANGGGGGASGGNGGAPAYGTSTVSPLAATAGSIGYSVLFTTPAPENLLK